MARRTLLVIAAIQVAAIGTARVWYYVQSADERARAGQAVVTVYLPRRALDSGTPLQTALDGSDPTVLLSKGVPPSSITAADLAGLAGKVLKQPVPAGQTLTTGMFTAPGGAASMTGLKEDKLAIEVSLADPNRAAGLLHAGSEIAVFATSTTPEGATAAQGATAAKARKTWLLLENVKVLSGGSAAAGPQGGGTAGVPQANVVLEVDQVQAQKVILTQAGGNSPVLWFALRGSATVPLKPDLTITDDQLRAGTP
jgi:pilus assembly protein CpaB